MLSKKKLYAVIGLCTFFVVTTTSAALAHEFIIKPSARTVTPNTPIAIELQAAHVFMVSEEVEAVADVELAVVQNGKRTVLPVNDRSEKLALTSVWTPETPASAMLIGHRKIQVWSDTTEGVVEGTWEALEKKGMRVLSEGSYEKFSKVILPGATGNEEFTKAVGQLLEIVPSTDLNAVEANTPITMHVFYDGKALANTIIQATYDGFSPEEEVYALTSKTNEDGSFSLTADKAGLWMVRVAHDIHTSPEGAAQKTAHILRAVLVFVVN